MQSFADNTISGTVSLPAGHVAPPGGMNIGLSVYDVNSSQQTDNSSSAFINEGETSAGYSLTVPPAFDASWEVSYSYWGSLLKVIETGCYNSIATTLELDRATLLAGAEDHSGINMKLHTTEGLIRTTEDQIGKIPGFLEGQLFFTPKKINPMTPIVFDHPSFHFHRGDVVVSGCAIQSMTPGYTLREEIEILHSRYRIEPDG